MRKSEREGSERERGERERGKGKVEKWNEEREKKKVKNTINDMDVGRK